jgi:hypothetical protein
MYYEVKVQYLKTDESGKEKKVTETYLAQTETCADAENLVCEELAKFVSTEIRVKSVKQSSIEDLVAYEDDEDGRGDSYLIKVNFITIDEVSGFEKLAPHLYLTSGATLEKACNRFTKEVVKQGWMADMRLASISLSPIIDVYKRV